MEGRIERLHAHYRVAGANGSTGSLVTRLDRLAQGQVADVLGDALDQALGDDPAVYVLRRVQVDLSLNVDEETTDSQLAQRWGEQLAGAVARSIARDLNDGTNLARFTDQADYVAHFVTDLVEGKAWGRWFYGAFASLRSRNTPDVVRTVLLDHRDDLPAVLSYLHGYGKLEQVLAAVDAETLRRLWVHGLDAHVSADPEVVRPLVEAAMRLVDCLGLWARSRPASSAVLEAYVATGPPPVDWRDRRGLTAALLGTLQFLANQGYLRRVADGDADRALPRLKQILSDFDWLDVDSLQSSLLELLNGADRQHTGLPTRPPGQAATPRQRELLADLSDLLRGGAIDLNYGRLDSPANALRLYAALVARAPRWTGDALATGVIQRLLTAWVWLAQTRSPAEAARHLQQGNVEAVLRMLPEDRRLPARSPLKFLANLGEAGFNATETLLRGSSQASSASREAASRLGTSGVGQAKMTRALKTIADLDRTDLLLMQSLLASASIDVQRLGSRDAESVLRLLSDERRLEITGALQVLNELSDADWQWVIKLITDTPADTLRRWRGGDAGEILQALPEATRSGVTRTLRALAGLRPVDIELIRALLSGLSLEPMRRLRYGDEVVAFEILLEGRRTKVADMLQALLDLDGADLALVKNLIGGAVAEAVNRFRRGAQQTSDLVPAEGREAAVLEVFKAVADMDEADLSVVRSLAVRTEDLSSDRVGIETDCAGVFLLLRAVRDTRLAALVEVANYPPLPIPPNAENQAQLEAGRLGYMLLALGLQWAGKSGLVRGWVDLGLSLLAGLDHPFTLDALRTVWSVARPEDHRRFQVALLRVLAGQRLFRGGVLHLYRVTAPSNQPALVAGDTTTGPWPLGWIDDGTAVLSDIVLDWLTVCEEATGRQPTVITCDESLADRGDLQPALRQVPDVVVIPETPAQLWEESTVPDFVKGHRAGREALGAALAALDRGRLELSSADLTISLTAIALLRLWARWLRGFAASSVPYLLENFVHRSGWIIPDEGDILVEMESRPLDLVLEMAGYFDALEEVVWLGHNGVKFEVRG